MLSLEIDAVADAMYLRLTHGSVHSTAEVDEGTLVDLDEAGGVVGIEIIGRRRALPLQEIFTRFPFAEADQLAIRLVLRSGSGAVVTPTSAAPADWSLDDMQQVPDLVG